MKNENIFSFFSRNIITSCSRSPRLSRRNEFFKRNKKKKRKCLRENGKALCVELFRMLVAGSTTLSVVSLALILSAYVWKTKKKSFPIDSITFDIKAR